MTDSGDAIRASLESGNSNETAKNLAQKIIERKKTVIMNDPNFKKLSKEEQDEELRVKSEIYREMDRMIDSLKKYRRDFSG